MSIRAGRAFGGSAQLGGLTLTIGACLRSGIASWWLGVPGRRGRAASWWFFVQLPILQPVSEFGNSW
jgi:hypothetical protein